MFGLNITLPSLPAIKNIEAAIWIGAAVAVPAWFVLEHWRLYRRLSKMVKVKELWIYPIKSCAGYKVQSVKIDELGFENDRRFMVAKPDGTMVTQREFPRMALIQTKIEGDTLIVSAPEVADLRINIKEEPKGEKLTVNVWDDLVVTARVSAESEEWFTKVIGKPAILVKTLPKSVHSRPIDGSYHNGAKGVQASFADGFPMLLANKTSLDDLNNRLTEKVSMRNFRPNIVVENCPPWEEDSWGHVRIGALDFDIVKPCDRCAIPSVNPDTGKFSPDIEPIRTMRRVREVGSSVIFGQNVIQRVAAGTLTVGDDVKIFSTRMTGATWLSV